MPLEIRVLTEEEQRKFDQDFPEDEREDWSAIIPAGRLADPNEIGRVVAWLCSDEAEYVTGTAINATGGFGI